MILTGFVYHNIQKMTTFFFF